MLDISIEERLKLAELQKLLADTEKIKKYTTEMAKGKKLTFWSEVVKIIGGLIVVVGAVLVALFQIDAAETKVKYVKDKLELAEASLKTAENSTIKANKDEVAAIDSKNRALEAKKAADEYVSNLKIVLAERSEKLEAIKPEAIKSKLVYIQFQGDIPRSVINELRGELENSGYKAPGAERLAGNYRPLVKYFLQSDKDSAQKLANNVQSFFAKKGCPIVLSPEFTKTTIATSPFELWIPHNCS